MTTPARPRLLVVDDQPLNIHVMYEIFGADHDVLMATSGMEALQICSRQAPDLVLLDVSMPGIDGLEVCRRLKADPALQDIPVIFVTAGNSVEEESRGFAAGAVDFITKPVNPVVVRARVRTHLTLKSQSDMLRNLAFVDGLTGIPNRRRFDEVLAREWRICSRAGEALAVAVIDVDHFKLFNDRYGHPAGDDCLRLIASALQGGLRRPRDLVARIGGEEFGCIVPNIEAGHVVPFFEELRETVSNLRIPHESSPTFPFVTISIGLKCAVPEAATSPSDFVAAADAALYEAKQRGRNRSVRSTSRKNVR